MTIHAIIGALVILFLCLSLLSVILSFKPIAAFVEIVGGLVLVIGGGIIGIGAIVAVAWIIFTKIAPLIARPSFF